MDNEQLEKYFNFDDSDLYANRNGWLSEKQQQRLAQEAKSGVISGIGCGLFFFAIASIFPIVWTPTLWSMRDQIGPVVMISFGVLVWVLVWGFIGVILVRGAFDKPNLTLQKAEGPVNIVGVERQTAGKSSHTYIAYELRIGGHEFEVETDLADYVMQGDIYAVYFLEGSEQIMSLERI